MTTDKLKLSPCGQEPRITTYQKGIVGGELWICTIQAGAWKIEINGMTPKLAEDLAIEIWNCRTLENDHLTAENARLTALLNSIETDLLFVKIDSDLQGYKKEQIQKIQDKIEQTLKAKGE